MQSYNISVCVRWVFGLEVKSQILQVWVQIIEQNAKENFHLIMEVSSGPKLGKEQYGSLSLEHVSLTGMERYIKRQQEHFPCLGNGILLQNIW